jgi:hypothetical protein
MTFDERRMAREGGHALNGATKNAGTLAAIADGRERGAG